MDKWTLFFAAIGLAMVLEGLPYFISPRAVRRYLRALDTAGEGTLRGLGLSLIVAGLLICYFATR